MYWRKMKKMSKKMCIYEDSNQGKNGKTLISVYNKKIILQI